MSFRTIFSFVFLARPNADGRAFLEQLLDSMKSSENDEDNRSSTELADDIGVPETILLSFSSAEPQKTALRIFNALFPTNQDKQSLINVANMNVEHPTLLENILGEFLYLIFRWVLVRILIISNFYAITCESFF